MAKNLFLTNLLIKEFIIVNEIIKYIEEAEECIEHQEDESEEE